MDSTESKYEALIRIWEEKMLKKTRIRKPTVQDAINKLNQSNRVYYFFNKEIGYDFSCFPKLNKLNMKENYDEVMWLTGC